MKRRTALVGSLATPLATLADPLPVRADTLVDLQLVLAVDVSRSIDEVEAELQRHGYTEALTNRTVIDAILSGEHKRIALCYAEWAGTHYQMVVIDWSLLDSRCVIVHEFNKVGEVTGWDLLTDAGTVAEYVRWRDIAVQNATLADPGRVA